jgi:amino acid transporter
MKTTLTLTRRFTPMNLLMVSINGMVGSAWLFAPLYAAKIAGSGAIIAWIIGGVLTATIALTFAELSVMFPVAGGSAQIPQLSHGTFTSFMMSWIAWLAALTMAPIEVQAILQYASNYFTSLVIIHQGTPILSTLGLMWATFLMLSLCFINSVSYKGLMRFNGVIFLFKIMVIVLVIMMLIKTSFNSTNFSEFVPAISSLKGWQSILTAVATGGVAFAFTGFKHGIELAGETKKMALAIPLAVIGSVLLCLLLYLGLQVAFIGALNPEMLSHGWNNLSFIGDMGPFAGITAGLGIFWLVKLLYVDAVVSPGGAGLIYVTSTARILYAMSQIGYLPRWVSKLNNQQMPIAAILINFVLGMFLFLPLPGWQAMVSFLVSGMVISYASGPIALLCLRLELPSQPRHFHLPAAKIICLLAFYFCNLLAYWTGWETISKLAIAMLLGVAFFAVGVIRGRLNVSSYGFKSAIWIIPYLVGLVAISYLGAFGGENIITFGWDFIVIGLFSTIILYCAVKNRAKVPNELTLDPTIIEGLHI